MLSRIKASAKQRGVVFNLDLEDIIIPDLCPVLGTKLQRNVGGKGMSPSSPSVDRIIPELGYTKGNIMVISQRANVMKNDATLEELERFANWVLNELTPLSKTSNTP